MFENNVASDLIRFVFKTCYRLGIGKSREQVVEFLRRLLYPSKLRIGFMAENGHGVIEPQVIGLELLYVVVEFYEVFNRHCLRLKNNVCIIKTDPSKHYRRVSDCKQNK